MRQEIFDILLLVGCAYALVRGGAPERTVSLVFLTGDALSVALVNSRDVRFQHEEYGVLIADLLVFMSAMAIALRSTRWWPLVVAALQMDAVIAHILHSLAPNVMAIVYLDATAIWAYPMLFCLIAGTWRHQMRLQREGEDRPWKRPFSDPVPRN
jgi:hypothetical protein